MSSEIRQRKLNQQRQKIRENQNKKHIQQLKSIQINNDDCKLNLKFSSLKEEYSPLVERSNHKNECISKFAYDGPHAFEMTSGSKENDKEIEIYHLNHVQQDSNRREKPMKSNLIRNENNHKKTVKESGDHGFNYLSMKHSESENDTEEDFDIDKKTKNEELISGKIQNHSNFSGRESTIITESSENDLDSSTNLSNVAIGPSDDANKHNEIPSSGDVESIPRNNTEDDLFNSLHEKLFDSNMEIESFVTKPAPGECIVKCRITRNKKGMDKGIYPTYYLHLERKDTKPLFLLAARRRKLSKTSNYLISCDATDMKKSGFGYLAKLRSNFIGTQFTIYDNGQNPTSVVVSNKPLRKELGAIIYETNVLGFKGPRKMTVVIPGMTPTKMPIDFQPKQSEDDLLECCRTRKLNNLLELHNKKPVWNEDSQSYVLNFHGRVTQASVKNFQIVHDNDVEYIIMQFGRTSDNSFSMDFAYPLSAVQAFGIALSSFDGKLACE